MATSLKHWISLALILAASASYLSLDLRHHDWSFDDDNYIEDARMAQSRFSHVFSPDKAGAGRPTVHLYFYALFPIFEEDPGKYHVANLFVHAANAFLLATLVHRLGANFWVAASTGLLFYFSLSHFRAILWISGIGHLLASGFGLTSCLVLLRHVRVRRRGLLWISVAFFAAAAWAHQSAVVFLPLFFILLFQRDRSFPWRDLAPLCAVPIAVFLASKFLYATPLSDDGGYTAGLHLLSNPLNQLFRLFGGYFLDPTTASGARGSDYRMGLALILILGFIALRNRSIRLPALWTIVSLLPFSLWPAGSDNWRYYYLPSTGSSVLVALLFGWLGEHSGRLLRVPMLRYALPFVMTAAVAGVNLAHMPCLQAVQFFFSGQYFQRIKQNHRKAMDQYRNAQTLCADHPFAPRWQFNMAMCNGALGNREEAINALFRLAAEQGHASAQYNLGVMYATGEGVPEDDAEAVRWYRMAAEQSNASAQYNLGVMYYTGEGVPGDDAEAARWYRMAAEQGYASAQYNLGLMYAIGTGVLKDATLAHMWLNIAGANGSEIAREWRDTIEDDMTATQIARATELAPHVHGLGLREL